MPRNELATQLIWQSDDAFPGDAGGQRTDKQFWKTKPLDGMTTSEWESLCDGCGQCCLIKLEDEDTGDIAVTRLSCKLLEIGSCRCSDYANRQAHVHDCVKLTPEAVKTLKWLPKTCGYRLVAEGRDLFWWHPLVSGREETVHEAGISIRGVAIAETKFKPERFPDHIIEWLKPRRRR
jgi:uncharacterized cysteine cluster protein YcgN (CxxCxxCC family)